MATDSRWKYLVVTLKAGAASLWNVKDEQLQEDLNQKGMQGWELIHANHNPGTSGWRLIYKKPM
ncbi:MAG TPA: hypothetical protein VIT67_01660 [Povalibacter sp.]|jgi:hypothetical protein